MRILYETWLCPFSRSVRLILNEKKLDYILEFEKTWAPKQRFLALNPAGEVPVLIDLNHIVVADCRTIIEYLEEMYPEVSLYGKTLEERTETRRLIGWFHHLFYTQVTRKIVYEKIFKQRFNEGLPDSQLIREGQHHLRKHLEYVEWLTDRRKWLAGPFLSAADMAAAAHLSCIDYLDAISWDKHPGAKDWYARIKSRPSFRPLLKDEQIPNVTPPSHYKDLDF